MPIDEYGNEIQFPWVENHVEPLKLTVYKNPPAWVDATPAPLQNPDASPADIAAYRLARSVKREDRLPIEQTIIPEQPKRPSYIMEPSLEEVQSGQMHFPPGLMQEDSGRFYYKDDPTKTVPMVRRPGLLPVALTPEGLVPVMPKMVDLIGNVMGNVGGKLGGAIKAMPGEVVLGSGPLKITVTKPDWTVKGFEDANWYHGTTHEFNKFSKAKGNPENHLGQYPHFTSNVEDASHNYAGRGPDLTGRIERRAEELVNNMENDLPPGQGFKYGTPEYENAYKIAREKATKELQGHEGAIIPTKMNLQNPASLVEGKPTWINFNNRKLTQLLGILERQGEKYGFDGRKVFAGIADSTYGEVTARDLDKALRSNDTFMYAEGPKGELISSHLISEVFKGLGFDGIVMDAKSAFPNMKNIPEGTLHAVPLKKNTVKGKYTDDVLFSDTRPAVAAQVAKQLEKPNQQGFYSALERATKTLPDGTMSGEQWWNRIWEPGSTKQVGVRDANNKPVFKRDANNNVILGPDGKPIGEFKTVEVQPRSLLPGVKAEELEVLGLEKWLKDQKGPVSKQQIEDYVKQNKVELKEKVLGDDFEKINQKKFNDKEKLTEVAAGELDDAIRQTYGGTSFNFQGNKIYADELSYALYAKDIKYSELPKELQASAKKLQEAFEARELAREELKNSYKLPTKYHELQLPGGENYQETLLSLPEGKNVQARLDAINDEMMQLSKEYANSQPQHILKAKGITKEELANKASNLKAKMAKLELERANLKQGYRAPHFDEHGTNLVAHVRHNERKLPIPFNEAETAALQAHEEAGAEIMRLQEAQASVGKEIRETAKPLDKARRDKILADNKAGKLSNVEAMKALEGYFEHPELKPLQDKLTKLRQEEDNVIKALPKKPEQKFNKSLHVEEVQSDLHQTGRDYGYKGEKAKLEPQFQKIEQKIINSNDEAIMGNPDLKDALKMAVDKKLITKEEASIYERYTKVEAGEAAGKTVPDFPFKKNWEELAWKRMLYKAINEGYDSLSWTPGEAQALRYQNEIRQKLKTIEWSEDKLFSKYRPDKRTDLKRVRVDGEMGETWIDVDKNGNVVHAHNKELQGETLDRVIGKDLAKQIMEKGHGTIDAKGYVMGAEGMKQAYDKRGVDILNNLTKKYGAKVESVNLGKANNIELKKQYVTAKGDESYGVYNNGKLVKGDMFKDEAEKFFNQLKKTDGENNQPIHILKITPELREGGKKGFSLFSSTPVLSPVTYAPEFDTKQKPTVKLVPVSQPPVFE